MPYALRWYFLKLAWATGTKQPQALIDIYQAGYRRELKKWWPNAFPGAPSEGVNG